MQTYKKAVHILKFVLTKFDFYAKKETFKHDASLGQERKHETPYLFLLFLKFEIE